MVDLYYDCLTCQMNDHANCFGTHEVIVNSIKTMVHCVCQTRGHHREETPCNPEESQ